MSSSATAAVRHAINPLNKQRQQLDKLFKNPEKPVYIPSPPQELAVRPPRDMMKNVQGSSAGAGSGEFHVYRAGRRREYERLAILAEQLRKEADEKEFERRRAQAAASAEAKTAKNRHKRLRKKARSSKCTEGVDSLCIKRRRLVNGEALAFPHPAEDSDDTGEDEQPLHKESNMVVVQPPPAAVLDGAKITFWEDE